MSRSGSSSKVKVATAGPKPLFGVEIEIFVKIHDDLARKIRDRRYREPHTMQQYWLDWEFDLTNARIQGNQERKAKQRECVGKAIREIIDITLGDNHGWTCESDDSLKEWALTEPDEPRKWWGIEIISPPMSVTKHWQEEIELIFAAVGKHFDFWTNQFCACHVHVSPGPTKKTKYTTAQLVKMAKGAYFWEEGFYELLPPERRNNSSEYDNVPTKGWGPVFSRLSSVASLSEDVFIQEMKGGANETRYVSTSFHPFPRLGTVELRRQAGVASAMTAIHRILLALTLHVSAFRYDFDGAKARKTRPDGAELIRELAGCIKKLPSDTCHGSRFINFLYWCQESYAGNKCYTEKQINAREAALRKGIAPPNQRSSLAPPPSAQPAAGARPLTPGPASTNTTTLPSRPASSAARRAADPAPRASSSSSRASAPRPSGPSAPRQTAPTTTMVSSSGNRTIYEVREPQYRY
ncbi:putative amidoligase enzyme-domain-containing protein [Chaetomium sp. MPI-CAGE-AT-0009]|nr:putative amidoligase enzyme-domain-containing protein [Chaetomium sp. MPI-CAGE-AT-0009]